jgi:hypothetical protein
MVPGTLLKQMNQHLGTILNHEMGGEGRMFMEEFYFYASYEHFLQHTY